MSFFTLSNNEKVDGSKTFESGGGNFEPLPEGTTVLAAPVEAGWKVYEGLHYINIQWQVLAPAAYKNRRIFQKIKTQDFDAKVKDKALRMLAAIDANAGGALLKAGTEPTDQSLAKALVGKQMQLRLGLWEIDGKSGNWVQAVSPKGETVTRREEPESDDDKDGFNDDIPF